MRALSFSLTLGAAGALIHPLGRSLSARATPWRAPPRMAIDVDIPSAQGLADSFQAVSGSIGEQMSSVTDGIGGIGSAISAAKDGALNSASSFAEGLSNSFNGATASALRPFQDAAEGVQNSIAGAKTGAAADLANAAGDVAQSAKGALDSALSRFGLNTDVVVRETEEAEKVVGSLVSTLEGTLTPRRLYGFDNLIVLPFWLSMIAAPNNEWTKRIMGSLAPFFLCGMIYAWLAYESFQDPTSLETFSKAVSDLGALSKGIGASETAGATVWAHIIAQDLFVGRWVYLDGRRNNVWTAHSLALCFLFGPCGVFSHLLTRGAAWIFNRNINDVIDAGMVRASAAPALAAASSTPTAASQAQASAKARSEEILSRAKDEAASIVQRAKAEAAQLKAAAAALSAREKAAAEPLASAKQAEAEVEPATPEGARPRVVAAAAAAIDVAETV